ncbi:hypothetical protein [Aquibacillus salsiterrae]|uniref:Uncharacterized protein n=1 Tax=Aquibacillus salsiterrae TaxID=2950439 RepID=A0A9X3WFJ6_9BACI|nr:hypothetical protein [Aquibacillus salsiterrae]MDC3417390.1 hypothetical protein [Aquibacillus salsiterrae]
MAFDSIKVFAIDTNSGIFIGTNRQGNWSSASNNKSGFGTVKGSHNHTKRNINIFKDDDMIDTPIKKINYK